MPGADDTLRVITQVDVNGIRAGMGEAASAVEAETERMNEGFRTTVTESEKAFSRVNYSSVEARHAIHGLGEEIGIHVPRFVQTFVAELGGVGPLMAAAFTPIAVAGLIQVLGELPEAVQKGIDKLAGFDDELKKTYSDAFKENLKLQSEALETAHKLGEIGLIGKEGPELARAKMKLLGDDEQRAAELANEITQSINHLKASTQALEPKATSRGWDDLANMVNGNREKIKQNKEELVEYQAVLDTLVEKMRQMNAVEKPRGRAEIIEADEKAQEKADQEAERDFHARTIAEIRDASEAAKEKTRILAEEAKANAEWYKKVDAEEKELDREIARTQEEQLRRAIEMQNKEFREKEQRIRKEVEEENQAFNKITADVNHSFISWMNGQETFGRAAQKVWTGIADDAVSTILKIGEKWVAQHLFMAAISKLFHVQDAASEIAAITAKIAALKAFGTAQVGLAGTSGVASMAAAPFPIDTTAPAFGASMATSAARFLAFEAGGIMPRDDVAMLHAKEMVLPAHISESVQRAAEGGTMGPGGGHTFNYHNYAPAANDQAKTSSREFFRSAKRELRRLNR